MSTTTTNMQKSTCNSVREICDPLFDFFKINFFSHTRAFHDGNFSSLMTSTELTDYYLEKKYPIRFSHGKGFFLDNGYYIEEHLEDLPLFIKQELRDQFNTDHFFYIINKSQKFDDMYVFATAPENKRIINQYINNLDMLKQFVLYYSLRSDALFKKVKPQQHEKESFLPLQKSDHSNMIITPIQQKESCLHRLSLKKIKSSSHLGEFTISPREYECLKYIAKSHTIKETAKILQLSPRTVETYINNLKNKLGCATQRELLRITESLDLL